MYGIYPPAVTYPLAVAGGLEPHPTAGVDVAVFGRRGRQNLLRRASAVQVSFLVGEPRQLILLARLGLLKG